MPWILYDAGVKQCRRWDVGSFGRYVIRLVLHSIITEYRDRLMREVANADPDDQDELIRYFLTVPLTKKQLLRWIRTTKESASVLFRAVDDEIEQE